MTNEEVGVYKEKVAIYERLSEYLLELKLAKQEVEKRESVFAIQTTPSFSLIKFEKSIERYDKMLCNDVLESLNRIIQDVEKTLEEL